jgi:GMP synthase (glutamine-hydrolysing)
VAAALVHKAIGHQLTCVFVDTGLMRKDEGEQVVETFQRTRASSSSTCGPPTGSSSKLAGVTDPEDKRKAIGELFIRVFEDAAGRHHRRQVPGAGHALPRRHRVGRRAQGRHHQEPPQRRRPPRRHGLRAGRAAARAVQGRGPRVGEELGLPEEIVWRQPFPGPGLGVRIIGEVTPTRSPCCRRPTPSCARSSQGRARARDLAGFAVLPDIRSVGVMGDERTYGYPIIIRAVTSEDAMTADWARCPTTCSSDVEPHHQRGARRQPGGLRHHVEAARHHRVGVTGTVRRGDRIAKVPDPAGAGLTSR